MQDNNQIFDEKVFSMLKKIEVPKNPFSFYFNISKIEKNLSEWLRDYFYKAINEFLYHSEDKEKNNKNNFLLKIYYYTGFIEKIAFEINKLLKDLKYCNISFYLDSINEFDPNTKLKAVIFNIYKNNPQKVKDLFKKSLDDFNSKEILQDHNIKDLYDKDSKLIFKEFETHFYSLDSKKDEDLIDFIYKNININILKYSLSYKRTKQDYKTFVEKWWEKYIYYKATNVCLDKIVSKYNKNQTFHKNTLIYKIISNIENIRKNYHIKSLLDEKTEQIGKKIKFFDKWKKIYNKKYNSKYFKYEFEFEKFFITYIINNKHSNFKKLLYWEATKERFSEDNWANIWWANIFYLQKIDENIWHFEMLMFFKQFKDTLINLNNSLSWPFIKPYFYYILIFKAIKLPLKDWQKLFFLLMFFSAESYQEYIILQNIMKSIEKIWLWKINIYNSKLLFYIKRFFTFFIEFFSSIILWGLVIIWFYVIWFINIIMLWIIFLIVMIGWIKYIFFPWRFEILRTFSMLSIGILWYIWFSTIFPKITQPQYISYVWWTINSLVSLDFSWTKKKYDNMMEFIYGKNYKENEKNMIAWIYKKIWKIKNNVKNNKNIQQITKNTTNAITAILKKPDEYINIRKWTYLKYYINKEIDNLNVNFNKKQTISKKVVQKYIQWYCFIHQDIYCKNRLEKLPVGFKLNITKIKEFIKKNL